MDLSTRNDPERLLRKHRRVCSDLARTAQQDSWRHCIGAAILVALAGWWSSHLAPVALAAIVISSLAMGRRLLGRVVDVVPSRVWLRWYSTTVVLASLAWGVVFAGIVFHQGLGDPLAMPLVLILTGISSGGVNGLAAHRSTQLAQQAALWFPGLVVAVLPSAG